MYGLYAFREGRVDARTGTRTRRETQTEKNSSQMIIVRSRVALRRVSMAYVIYDMPNLRYGKVCISCLDSSLATLSRTPCRSDSSLLTRRSNMEEAV